MGLTTKKYFRRLLYAKILLVVMLGVSLAVAAIFWSFPTDIGAGYHNAQATLRGIQKVLFWRVALYCLVTFALIMPAIVWILLFYSHRIAGPAYRLGQEALKIGRGDLAGGVVFRQHDSLTDMADSLNELACWYRERVDAVQTSLSAIDRQSDLLAESLRRGGADQACLKSAAAEIAGSVAAIESNLQQIRT